MVKLLINVSKISCEKEKKIKEDILRELYDCYPGMLWTYSVAENIARDEEFVLRLLRGLAEDKVVIVREESGKFRVKRKWGLSEEVYGKYKEVV